LNKGKKNEIDVYALRLDIFLHIYLLKSY